MHNVKKKYKDKLCELTISSIAVHKKFIIYWYAVFSSERNEQVVYCNGFITH